MANGQDAINALIEEGRARIRNTARSKGLENCPAHADIVELQCFNARCHIVQLERSREDEKTKSEERRYLIREAKATAIRWAVGLILTLGGTVAAVIWVAKN